MTQTGGVFGLITDPDFGSAPAAGTFGGMSSLMLDDALLILAAGFSVALLLALWARYGRNRGRPDFSGPASTTLSLDGRGRRRRRRTALVRNPTRAETGGLPPLRTEGPLPPTS